MTHTADNDMHNDTYRFRCIATLARAPAFIELVPRGVGHVLRAHSADGTIIDIDAKTGDHLVKGDA